MDIKGIRHLLNIYADRINNNHFWFDVFEDLKSRGVKNILFLSVDDNKNIKRTAKIEFLTITFSNCITSIYPKFYKYISERSSRNIAGKIKTGLDATNFLDSLLQPLMQKLLDIELDNHLDYNKYEHSKSKNTNSRNVHCKPKTVKTEYGNIEVETPRDRKSTFEHVITQKGQTRLTGLEDKCIALYAKDMSLRDIENILKEIYGVKINKAQITKLISAVNKETEQCKYRKLKLRMYLLMLIACTFQLRMI